MKLVIVKGGVEIEIGELVVIVSRTALLIHVHIGSFDKFFGITHKGFTIDPIIWYENTKTIRLRK